MGLHILCIHFRAVIQQQPGQLIVAPGGSCVERGCLLHWHCAVFLASAAELPKLGESHGGYMGGGMEEGHRWDTGDERNAPILEACSMLTANKQKQHAVSKQPCTLISASTHACIARGRVDKWQH